MLLKKYLNLKDLLFDIRSFGITNLMTERRKQFTPASVFKIIERNLKKYRQFITTDDVTFQNGIIRLEINGRRTNIKSQLLLGFFSVGRAIQKSSYPFREVQIIIYYEIKESQQLVVTASIDKVLKLAQGRLGSEQFFNEIGY